MCANTHTHTQITLWMAHVPCVCNWHTPYLTYYNQQHIAYTHAVIRVQKSDQHDDGDDSTNTQSRKCKEKKMRRNH